MKHALPVIYDDETKTVSVSVKDDVTGAHVLQPLVKITAGAATGTAGQVISSDGTNTSWGAAPAAPGGIAGSVEVTVNFGTGKTLVTTTVTGQTWAAALTTMAYLCSIGNSTADRASPAEEACMEGLRLSVQNIVAGVGFDLIAAADSVVSGTFKVQVVGVSL